MSAPAILLGLTGLRIDGGIASVGRCVARALDECVTAGAVQRTDRVLLHDLPRDAPPPPARGVQRLARGSQPRFAWQLYRTYLRRRHPLVFFDIVGLARAAQLPLPPLPPERTVIFAHGIELEQAREGARARALEHAWRILANSQFTANALADMHPQLADRVRVVPLCIEPERIAAWESGAPTPLRREQAALIVGRMWSKERGKGHDELLAAWPTLRAAVPSAELWIAGTGDDVPRLEALARERGAEGVHFLGRISDAELAARYARASVYAMPSRQEGFGLAYAEAMWFGTPCLASTADAAVGVVEEGETGRLVRYGDVDAIARALVDLFADPERTRALGERARIVARERFSYARFRSDLLAALELTG